ncbi:hypothetical protein [Nocardioides sp. zg-1228]|uniref:hypothetical protein n=1 Tax=Nocardioides sp. zg-1228 TaxID=2763008 RepID=UPI00164323C8|nr:hypothetical protein [Nocardioides sp. zg-1228]MBC2932226.1 hypothetical protein [Nocardioides sp. zg-1228]QSF57754.1 hypothetical protein JX575_00470 [Nocardioides sp. zg-1228]
MTIHARLGLAGAAVLLAATSACGAGEPPTDADEDRFCDTADSLMSGLLPEDPTDSELPRDEDMARAVRDWGARMEEVGTPAGIPDEARKGFEAVVEQAKGMDASDFSLETLRELEGGGADSSEQVQAQTDAFGDYLAETCGDPIDDLEMPELEGPDAVG